MKIDARLTFYWLSKYVVGALCTIVWRLRVIDAQKVPRTGPVIIASNHIAYCDPPAIGVSCPRPVSFMAKQELFDIWYLGWLIRLLYSFPIDRSRGDVASMKVALGVLKSGACLGIFPEGTRNKAGAKMPPGLGIALLASWSGAQVVPAFVSGTADANKLGRFTVRFGDPLSIGGGRKASREDLAKWSEVLMERIYELRETAGAH